MQNISLYERNSGDMIRQSGS